MHADAMDDGRKRRRNVRHVVSFEETEIQLDIVEHSTTDAVLSSKA